MNSLPQPRHSLTVVFSLGHLILAGGQSGGEKEEQSALPVLEYGKEEAIWVDWGNTTHVAVIMDMLLGT